MPVRRLPGAAVTLATQVIEGEEGAEAIRRQWDDLAVAASRPFCAPAWALAWWRSTASPVAAMRIVTASDGDRLVGLAPLWASSPNGARSSYETMAAHLSPPAGPVAVPGREAEVAAALTRALAEASPRPAFLRLEDQVGGARSPTGSPSPGLTEHGSTPRLLHHCRSSSSTGTTTRAGWRPRARNSGRKPGD